MQNLHIAGSDNRWPSTNIYNAIRRQDPEAARAAMRTRLSTGRERLVRVQEAAEQAGGIEVSP